MLLLSLFPGIPILKLPVLSLDLAAILQWNGKKTWTMMILLFAIGYTDQIDVAE